MSKNYKGGYQLLDLNGEDFTVDTPKTIAGIYDKIHKMNFDIRKMIILSNYKVDGVVRANSQVRFVKNEVSEGVYVLSCTVTSDKNPAAGQMFFYVLEVGNDDSFVFKKYRTAIVEA